MFKRAIVRIPGKDFPDAISSSGLGRPDYNLALKQHQEYIKALEGCGLRVTVLEPMEGYPDSVFVEDVALCTSTCAIFMRPGAESRRGETEGIREVISTFFTDTHEIDYPGTIEAGDIMMVDNHFYIGISERTNLAGAEQALTILQSYGYTGSTIALRHFLHLKTGVSYLENNTLLVSGELAGERGFRWLHKIFVDPEEQYAANSLWINGTVLVPSGNPLLSERIAESGYRVVELDMSEFRKADGGLSCLSLRF